MKKIFFIFALLGIISCNNYSENSTEVTNDSVVVDTIAVDTIFTVD